MEGPRLFLFLTRSSGAPPSEGRIPTIVERHSGRASRLRIPRSDGEEKRRFCLKMVESVTSIDEETNGKESAQWRNKEMVLDVDSSLGVGMMHDNLASEAQHESRQTISACVNRERKKQRGGEERE